MVSKKIEKLVEKTKKDKTVLAIAIFGSFARGEPHRDIDVCITLKLGKYSRKQLARKRLDYIKLFPDLDIRIFQQLPVRIQQAVLKDGKILFCNDDDSIYQIAFDVIERFEDFKPLYEEYIKNI